MSQRWWPCLEMCSDTRRECGERRCLNVRPMKGQEQELFSEGIPTALSSVQGTPPGERPGLQGAWRPLPSRPQLWKGHGHACCPSQDPGRMQAADWALLASTRCVQPEDSHYQGAIPLPRQPEGSLHPPHSFPFWAVTSQNVVLSVRGQIKS